MHRGKVRANIFFQPHVRNHKIRSNYTIMTQYN